jgi:hypothetical protein
MVAAVLWAGACLFTPADNPKVYYGTLEGAKKPAELVALKVFDEIPEYRWIKEKNLMMDDPEYFILLQKANARFFAAVKRAAQAAAFDAVAEKGSLPGPVPDLTRQTIDALER